MDEAAVRMGEYVEVGVKSALERSFLGNTDKLKLFAQGSSFEVYRSKTQAILEDKSRKAVPVAVKMLKGSPSYADQALYAHKQEFQLKQLQVVIREMRVLAHPPLRTHENILSILQYGFNTQGRDMDEIEDDEDWMKMQPFLVLEYAENRTLKDFLQLPKSLDLLKDLALDAALGVDALHSCGIVHGDMKLENVLVFTNSQRQYQAKISDFGHSITDQFESEYLGTEGYRPPEVLTLPSPLGHEQLLKCDVWAFGIVIYEMLLSTVPDESEIDNSVSLDALLSRVKDSEIFAIMHTDMRSLWLATLTSTLVFEPLRRSSMDSLCNLIDNQRKAQDFVAAPLDNAFLTPLEFIARYPLIDEQMAYYKRLVNLSVYGAKEDRSYYYFQLSQCAANGFGGQASQNQVIYSLIFSVKEEDEPSHPFPLSTVERISLLGRVTGHGPYARDIRKWEDDLTGCPSEAYYSQRIRRYRAGGLERLRKSGLDISLLEAPGASLEVDDLLKRLTLTNSDETVSVAEPPLDLPFLRTLPLFHLFCLSGDLEAIKRVHGRQGNPEALSRRDEYGITPLLYACMGGHADVVRWLVQEEHVSGDNVDNNDCTPLHWLGMFLPEEMKEMAKMLLALYPEALERASIGRRLPIHFLWLRGPPLHWAVSCRDRDAVSVLLENGADIQAEYGGYSSLTKAVEIHAYDIVELLLDKGAKTVLTTPPRRSAMHFLTGNAPIIRRQLVHGTKFYEKAAIRTIRKLEAHGCDVNSRDMFENTPLHKAIASPLERGDLYVLKGLLKSGAARNAQNDDGDTPIHIAIKLHWFDHENAEALFEILMDDELCFLDEQVNPVLKDKDGRYPSLVAALIGNGSIYIQALPSTNESLLGTDNDGKSFLDLVGTSSETKSQYVQDNIKRFRSIQLDVTLSPDCT